MTAGLPQQNGFGSASKARLDLLASALDVEAANELLSEREENEAYLAARPGEKYAAYFTNGGAVGLDLTGETGRYRVKWIDIASGQWGPEDQLQGGAVVTLKAPGAGNWAAAIVRE